MYKATSKIDRNQKKKMYDRGCTKKLSLERRET